MNASLLAMTMMMIIKELVIGKLDEITENFLNWGSRPARIKSMSDQYHLPIVSHYSFTPEWGEVHGCPSCGHLPNSPCNLIIFYNSPNYFDDEKLQGIVIHMLRPFHGNPFSINEVDLNTLPRPT